MRYQTMASAVMVINAPRTAVKTPDEHDHVEINFEFIVLHSAVKIWLRFRKQN
jgi:hypothetical protein